MTPRVVAIDGAAGSGKSTLARLLAVDARTSRTSTRARCIARSRWRHVDEGVDVEDEDALVR